MEKDLQTYEKFPPCAELVQGITPQQLPETKKQPISLEQMARAKELYAEWCKGLADYRKSVLSAYGDSQPLAAITQTCETALPDSSMTVGQWLDRMILDFKAVQRAKVIIENEMRQKLGLEQYSFKLSEIDYVSDIQNLLAAYASKPVASPKTIKLPTVTTTIIIGLVAVIIVLIVVIIALARRENMYGPSDILVNRQELVKIATTPRPIPSTYRRWY